MNYADGEQRVISLGNIVDKTELALDSFNQAMASFEDVLGDPELQGKAPRIVAGVARVVRGRS